MANCGRCKLHCSFEVELNGSTSGLIVPDGCICKSAFEHAEKFHYTCQLGDGNPKSPNHNCPYFEPLPDGEPSQVILAL